MYYEINLRNITNVTVDGSFDKKRGTLNSSQ